MENMVTVVGFEQVSTLVSFSRGNLQELDLIKKRRSAAGNLNKGHELDVDSREVSSWM